MASKFEGQKQTEKKTMKVIARAASFELLTFCSKRTKCGGKCQQRSRQRGFYENLSESLVKVTLKERDKCGGKCQQRSRQRGF